MAKCTGVSGLPGTDSSFKWDYVFVEVWESEEAAKNSLGKFIGLGDSELGKTGIYEKVLATFDKYAISFFEVISSGSPNKFLRCRAICQIAKV